MIIRPLEKTGQDISFCSELVRVNWGVTAAARCVDQVYESFRGGAYAPVFCLAFDERVGPAPVGFAAYQPSMKMKGSFDLIWLAVHPGCQGKGVGKALTEWRISEIKKRDGQMIELVTQRPTFFGQLGFTTVAPLGNNWYLMLMLINSVQI